MPTSTSRRAPPTASVERLAATLFGESASACRRERDAADHVEAVLGGREDAPACPRRGSADGRRSHPDCGRRSGRHRQCAVVEAEARWATALANWLARRDGLATETVQTMDKFREECGVFGIYGHTEAANLTYSGSMRCSIAARRASASPRRTAAPAASHKAMGYVADNFDEATSRRWRARARSATCATRRPARAGSRTRSRFSSTARTARSPSATTATS